MYRVCLADVHKIAKQFKTEVVYRIYDVFTLKMFSNVIFNSLALVTMKIHCDGLTCSQLLSSTLSTALRLQNGAGAILAGG